MESEFRIVEISLRIAVRRKSNCNHNFKPQDWDWAHLLALNSWSEILLDKNVTHLDAEPTSSDLKFLESYSK